MLQANHIMLQNEICKCLGTLKWFHANFTIFIRIPLYLKTGFPTAITLNIVVVFHRTEFYKDQKRWAKRRSRRVQDEDCNELLSCDVIWGHVGKYRTVLYSVKDSIATAPSTSYLEWLRIMIRIALLLLVVEE